MAPPKKRARNSRGSPHEDQTPPSILLADHRTAWLVKYASSLITRCGLPADDQEVELKASGETITASKAVLVKNSEYFTGCLNGQFREADRNRVQFDDDVDPRALALYVGLAYSHSSIVAHTPPLPAEHPEASAPRTSLRDLVEVYKLCDRFISHAMSEYVSQYIDIAIGDGHRALYRADSDSGLQKTLTRDFADGYEALEFDQDAQAEIGSRLISYFCEGVSYACWIHDMEDVMDRPRFVGAVSRGFAEKLVELAAARKLKRKELKGP